MQQLVEKLNINITRFVQNFVSIEFGTFEPDKISESVFFVI